MAVTMSSGGGEATVVTMGPPKAVDVLRESFAWGADHVWHITDPIFAGADALVTAEALAAVLKNGGPFDLVLAGRNSLDAGTGAVGPMVAELLDLPFVESVKSIERLDDEHVALTAETDCGSQTVTVRLPAVLSVAERLCQPTKLPEPNWTPAQGTPVRVWTKEDVTANQILNVVSQTRVTSVQREMAERVRSGVILDKGSLPWRVRTACQLLRESLDRQVGDALPTPASLKFDPADPARAEVLTVPRPMTALVAIEVCSPRELELVSDVAAVAAKVGAPTTVMLPAAGLGDSGVKLLHRNGAAHVVAVGNGDERPFARALEQVVLQRNQDTVFAISSTWGRQVMARLAARLSMGLITEVHDLRLDSEGLGGVKRGPGGDQLVEVRSTSEVRLFTVRRLRRCGTQRSASHPDVETVDLEPDASFQGRLTRLEDEWEALERAHTVVGVGKGVRREDFGRLELLRLAVDGEYAATRKVTDEGWLTHSRQVGITGRDIAPDLYIAVGISGNPNHLAAASRVGTLLAINSDPNAPIFDTCDVGLVAPWQDVVDLLATELSRTAVQDLTATTIG